MKHLPQSRKLPVALAAFVVLFFVGAFVFPYLLSSEYKVPSGYAVVAGEEISESSGSERSTGTASHVSTPEAVKGIYMSQCVVGTPSFRDSLVTLIDETSLNSVVIDIKDYAGKIAFTTDDPILKDSVSDACGARDMKAFVQSLHDKNIYVIGRVTVFQDPYYTSLHPEQAVQSKSHGGPWKDRKGLSFIDVSSQQYWDYVVRLTEVAHNEFGFDEINYDYIRYPSDGDMEDALYQNPNKAQAVEEFWKYLYENVEPIGVVTSADLFGMTASNTDDLGIGQVLERALPYFDYLMPMVYPSHYPKGFNGYSDPNLYPYEIIKYAMDRAVARTVSTTSTVPALTHTPIMETVTVSASGGHATTTKQVASGTYSKPAYPATKIRPWLQDFDYGKSYEPADILAQTKATYDAGLTSWIFWDPGNKYSSLRQVLPKE